MPLLCNALLMRQRLLLQIFLPKYQCYNIAVAATKIGFVTIGDHLTGVNTLPFMIFTVQVV